MIRSLFVLIMTLLLASPAAAADLGKAKSGGQACEQANGYLQATGDAPGDVNAMVKNINAKRKAQYQKIAQKNGVTVDQVAKLTANKLRKDSPQFACK